jgi:adenylosuccinate synthase
LPGWKVNTSNARKARELPRDARRYIKRLEGLIGCQFHVISIGPRREQSIIRKKVI